MERVVSPNEGKRATLSNRSELQPHSIAKDPTTRRKLKARNAAARTVL